MSVNVIQTITRILTISIMHLHLNIYNLILYKTDDKAWHISPVRQLYLTWHSKPSQSLTSPNLNCASQCWPGVVRREEPAGWWPLCSSPSPLGREEGWPGARSQAGPAHTGCSVPEVVVSGGSAGPLGFHLQSLIKRWPVDLTLPHREQWQRESDLHSTVDDTGHSYQYLVLLLNSG